MTPLIATHAFAACSAWLLGAWQVFLSTKGDARHRMVGRVWVGLALYVAISSFWMKELRPGQFSLLHILSVVTIVSVILGIFAARRGDLRAHQGDMIGPWIGMTFAGIFAFAIPERDLPIFIVTDPVGAVTAAVAVFLAAGTVLGLSRLLIREPMERPARVRG
jgi:uncharacterized membrane protein